MAIVYLSLGSNFGDRIGYVQQAASLLGACEGITLIRTSAFYETEPWGMNSENWFVNAVLEVKTSLTPQKLLEECLRIDIDILFYNKDIVNEENLIIPHKYVHLRAFTLVPLLELIPNFEHPVLHKTISELHNDLENPEMVFLYGTRVEI